MRTVGAVLSILALAGAASGAEVQDAAIRMKAPGQFGGDATLSGAWMVLGFAPEGSGQVELRVRGVLYNESHAYAFHEGDVVASDGPPVLRREREQAVEGVIRLSFGSRFGALVAHGGLEASEAAATGLLATGSPSVSVQQEDEWTRNGYVRPFSEAGHVLARAEVASFSASGSLTRIEWFGARVECEGIEPCPTGGGLQEASFGVGPERAGLRKLWHEGVLVEHGDVRVAEATPRVVSFGGKSVTLRTSGWTRLPLASPSPGCGTCLQTENRTLWAEGNITLKGLSFRDQETLGATFSGELSSTRLDEQQVDPHGLFGIAVGPAVGLGLATGLVGSMLFAFGLLARFSRTQALENPNRLELYHAILESPGIPFRELVRRASVATGTARYHLTVLVRSGLILEKPHNNLLRFFENDAKYEARWTEVGLMREPALRELHAWIQSAGAKPQKAILSMWEARGWSRSTTQHRLRRLVAAGLVQVTERGKYKVYEVPPSKTTPMEALPIETPG